MAIKERKQITGTTEQIQAYAGHEGQIVWDKEKKTLVGMSGTAGENYPLASQTYVANEVAKKASLEELTEGLAGKADKSHTHTVSQITDMPKVVRKVNNITPDASGNVPLGLHAVATSGDYNDLENKPNIFVDASSWSLFDGTNGWTRDDTTRFTIQWGEFYIEDDDVSVTFPISFLVVRSLAILNIRTGSLNTVRTLSNTGFYVDSRGNSGAKKWMAIGLS